MYCNVCLDGIVVFFFLFPNFTKNKQTKKRTKTGNTPKISSTVSNWLIFYN